MPKPDLSVGDVNVTIEQAQYVHLSRAVVACNNMMVVIQRQLLQGNIRRDLMVLGVEYADHVAEAAWEMHRRYADPIMVDIARNHIEFAWLIHAELVKLERPIQPSFMSENN